MNHKVIGIGDKLPPPVAESGITARASLTSRLGFPGYFLFPSSLPLALDEQHKYHTSPTDRLPKQFPTARLDMPN